MREKYTFQLTPQEGQMIVSALNELPYKIAKPIVDSLEGQFQAQLKEDEKQAEEAKAALPATPVTTNDNSNTTADTASA